VQRGRVSKPSPFEKDDFVNYCKVADSWAEEHGVGGDQNQDQNQKLSIAQVALDTWILIMLRPEQSGAEQCGAGQD
jgi:hypothetical protein